MNTRRKTTTFVFIFAFLVAFVVYTNFFKVRQAAIDYRQPSPSDVVRQYFVSWGAKDYANMYATISDGFKGMETTAKNLESFKNYVESNVVDALEIISVKDQQNDGTTAVVDYAIAFTTAGKQQQFSGSFTLRYRTGDVIQGWKLIHPYGDAIDTT